MNIISRLPRDHVFYSIIGLEHLIYFHLISSTVSEAGDLYSKHSHTEVYDLFCRSYGEKEVENAFQLLIDNKLIMTTEDDGIIIGTGDAKNKKLWTGNNSTWDKEFKMLHDHCDEYIKASSGVGKSLSRKLKESINILFSIPLEKWKTPEFSKLFQYTFEVAYQDKMRDLTPKETGHLMSTIKLYDTMTFIKMVVHYITHAELYTKGLPSTTDLMYKKDSVYASVKGVTAKKTVMREVNLDESF